jgi:hypothetical protein
MSAVSEIVGACLQANVGGMFRFFRSSARSSLHSSYRFKLFLVGGIERSDIAITISPPREKKREASYKKSGR